MRKKRTNWKETSANHRFNVQLESQRQLNETYASYRRREEVYMREREREEKKVWRNLLMHSYLMIIVYI